MQAGAMQREPLLQKAAMAPGRSLLSRRRMLERSKSQKDDELKRFRCFLRYLCADLTGCSLLPVAAAVPSWIAFSLIAVAVPVASFVLLDDLRPYDLAFQIPLTVAAGLAFNSLSTLCRKYGLRRSLFFDQLIKDSHKVQRENEILLKKELNTLNYCLLIPIALIGGFYKAYWYFCMVKNPNTAAKIPHSLTKPWVASIMCSAELISFMYRVAVVLLNCVLFKLNCCLQVLRMEDFTKVFHTQPDVIETLKHHLLLRKQLRIISHRHRFFIISFLITATASQFWTILQTTRPHAQFNLFVGGELLLGGASLVGGILMCLGSAACITHKAQALTSHAATWHACATINPCDPSMAADAEADVSTPLPLIISPTNTSPPPIASSSSSSSPPQPFLPPPAPTMAAIGVRWAPEVSTILAVGGDGEINPDASNRSLCSNGSTGSGRKGMSEGSDEEDDWDCDMDRLMVTQTTVSYQKRQAIVTYLENNKGGITIYGFVVDRTWLHALFMIEFSLVMWLLGKTVGI